MQKVTEVSYGSDRDGLVWGYHFVPGKPAEPITLDGFREPISAQDHADTSFYWLHFSLSNSGSEGWLRQNLHLPSTFYESLRSAAGSTTLELDANALVAVIHDVLFDFTFDASDVSTASLCLKSRLLVSSRLRPLRSVDRLRVAVRSGQTFRSPAEILAHLLREQAEVLADILRQSTARVDTIEDRLLTQRSRLNRGELGSLRRVLVRLQRLLAPEPAALFRLLSRPPTWITGEDLEDLRQAAEELSAAVSDTAALVERVKLLQEELAGWINEQSNRTLFVLTFVTVLALPINLVAGLFGMNVGGIPLAEAPHGFVVIVAALLALTVLLAYLAFSRRRD